MRERNAVEIEVGRMLWTAHEARGECPLTIFRYPFVLGPGNLSRRVGSCSPHGSRSGRPILLPGGGSAVNQHVYVDDAAGAILAALFRRRDAASGHAYNCAFPRGITNLGFVKLCATVLFGREASVVPIDEKALGLPTDSYRPHQPGIPISQPALHAADNPSGFFSDLGFESRVSTRRMIEEFAEQWPSVTDRKNRGSHTA